MAVSRQGCREGSRKRLPSLHPCLLTAIPICPPGGRPLRLSRTHGGRGRTLQRPHPPWPRHSRVGFLLWLDICENNIIGRADNHYFREISFFAMARCSLLGSCYGSVRPCALLLPRKKRQGRGRTLQRPHPCRFFGGQQDAAHPPPKRYPLWLGARCLVPAMARCVNAPSCSPKQRKGGLVLVRKRPFTSPPFRCLGGRPLRPLCPTQRRRKGQAGARPRAAVHQPTPSAAAARAAPPGGLPF